MSGRKLKHILKSLNSKTMKPRSIYTVESIYDWGAVFPDTKAHTNKKAAIEEAKWNFNDGAQCVRVIQHLKWGNTTMSSNEILRLEKQNK